MHPYAAPFCLAISYLRAFCRRTAAGVPDSSAGGHQRCAVQRLWEYTDARLPQVWARQCNVSPPPSLCEQLEYLWGNAWHSDENLAGVGLQNFRCHHRSAEQHHMIEASWEHDPKMI